MVDSESKVFQLNTIFWDCVEKYVVAVPEYVKNLLTLTGFDNVTALQSIDEADITEIESIARQQVKHMALKNPGSFFFIYAANPSQFRFVPGHKKLIFGLRTVVKDHTVEIHSQMQRRLAPDNEQPSPLPVITQPVSLASQTSVATLSQCLPPPKRKVSSTTDENERRLLDIINAYIERAQIALNDGCDYTVKRVTILANPNEEPVSAGIFCTICKNVIKIGTQSNLNGRRWIISNYVRHFRRHFPNFPLVNLTGNLPGMFLQSEQEPDDAKHGQEDFEIFCNGEEEQGSAIKRERRDGDYLSQLEDGAQGQ